LGWRNPLALVNAWIFSGVSCGYRACIPSFVYLALTPWLTRWISPDSAGAVDGLNLYVYVGGFVFTRNDGSATIGVVMFVTKGLGFVIQLQGVGL
jgi:hypothetical protein